MTDKKKHLSAPCEDCGAAPGEYCSPECQQELCKKPVVKKPLACPLCKTNRIKVFYTDPLQYSCGDCGEKLRNAGTSSDVELVPRN